MSDKLIEYLKTIKDHYISLAELMKLRGKEQYYHEHRGKAKFIDLLEIIKIQYLNT